MCLIVQSFYYQSPLSRNEDIYGEFLERSNFGSRSLR